MEMISTITIYGSVALTAIFAGVYGVRWIDRKMRGPAQAEVRLRRLSEESVRNELSGFLRKQMVIGDADIRQGVVFAPVPAEKLEPLAMALGNAAAALARMENRAADSLYVRNKDGSLALIDLDLDHLVDAARVMQRVAEDRHKSRSIYKGLTEDEMKALTRAGLSQFFKDRGAFNMSNKVMSGEFDEDETFLAAMDVLDLTFKVKGARND